MQVVRTETQAKKNLSQGRKIHKIQTGIMLDENYKKLFYLGKSGTKNVVCSLIQKRRENRNKNVKKVKRKSVYSWTEKK